MHKHLIDYILFIFVAVADIIVCWYTVILLLRTNWASRYTSIGYDSIIILYCLCIFAPLCTLYILIKQPVVFSKYCIIVLFVCSIILSAGFFYLNITGKVTNYHRTL